MMSESVNEKWAAITARNLHPEKKQHIINFVNWIDENMCLPDEDIDVELIIRRSKQSAAICGRME
mgnify:CR=1